MVEDGFRKKFAAFAIVELGAEVLLVANKRRAGRIKWSLPGGSVKREESPREALTREVREEAGVEVINWSEELIHTSLIKYR
ncbi:MAG: NUDIX domain-containing protein, partial [Dehalococcoidia bacterium]|nr:NUDIX domain-containing protein [Dehalococcoidia bacterium]